jgi:stage III sporulation protein SpoIIIAA
VKDDKTRVSLGRMVEIELAVYKRLGSYCVAYENMTGVIVDEIGSQRDANIILKAINDGVLSINEANVAEQIKTMRSALEEIEINALQYSYKDRMLKTIENLARRGLGKL